jgi:hypothetical protein
MIKTAMIVTAAAALCILFSPFPPFMAPPLLFRNSTYASTTSGMPNPNVNRGRLAQLDRGDRDAALDVFRRRVLRDVRQHGGERLQAGREARSPTS